MVVIVVFEFFIVVFVVFIVVFVVFIVVFVFFDDPGMGGSVVVGCVVSVVSPGRGGGGVSGGVVVVVHDSVARFPGSSPPIQPLFILSR